MKLVRSFLICVVIMGWAVGGPSSAVDAADQPLNVLFIAIDDLRPELGCYGITEAQSPSLDAFAETAVRFNNHFVQVPTCGASRYSLLTGRSPLRSGVTSSNSALYQGEAKLSDVSQPGAQSMPELFRRSGYQTVCIGKISHTADGRVYEYNGKGDGRDEVPMAWDKLATPLGAWKRGWGVFFAYPNGVHREDGQGHQDLMDFTATQDTDLPDGLMAQSAIEFLQKQRDADAPFFLGLGFFKPHLPLVAPKQDWDAFENSEIEIAKDQRKPETAYWHRSGEFYRYDAPFGKQHPLSKAAQRDARRGYLACVRYVDRQVGKVLDALQQNGLADNTVVVVWGDHGWHLGDQQIWGKHSPLERALRSVLMIRVPAVSKPGLVSDALVETLDVYPTLIDVCNPSFQQTHQPLDGKSLTSVIRGDTDSVREASLSYWKNAVSVRTLEHRLIAKQVGGEFRSIELYPTDRDVLGPNLADDQPAKVKEMLKLFEHSSKKM
ncbi:sulfatase [Novipirellula sp.]|uniref:sulfatase n=1 Tax=Novipirellula sp. TaxID=2795430 RepID=UPI0035694284